MRKILRVLVIAAALAVLSIAAVAAAVTATLQISVVVPKTVAISVERTDFAENLDFTDDPRDVHVGTVREMSNSLDGFLVYLSSENAVTAQSSKAFFSSSDGSSSSTIPYQISYGGIIVEFDSGTAKVTDHSGSTAAGPGFEREVRLVRLEKTSIPDPGLYSDTLTFTIAAK